MTDTTDKFDTLPHELEPTGAVQIEQDVCAWTPDHQRNHETSCGETWPAFIGLPAASEPCPWCARAIRIIEAAA